MNKTITFALLKQHSISFQEYIALAKTIISSDERPPMYQDEKMLKYTSENLARMENIAANLRIDAKLYNEMQQIKGKQIWVCITEPWCGDASQIVPALFLISSCSPNVEFRILLRDSNEEVMNNYLTNGGKSIPKLIMLHAESLDEIAVWGPRPASLQQMVTDMKDNPNFRFGEKVRIIHEWYDNNHSADLQEEFITLLKSLKTNTNA